MLGVQVWGCFQGDKKLRVICIWSMVGHGKQTRLRVAQLEVLIIKCVSVYGLSPSAIANSQISSLQTILDCKQKQTNKKKLPPSHPTATVIKTTPYYLRRNDPKKMYLHIVVELSGGKWSKMD
uniref:Uncharacterized protein n=1 Tax=Eptatretus burgeri TaxID=7764 RepID=A0A8C4Q5J1_EPTBU